MNTEPTIFFKDTDIDDTKIKLVNLKEDEKNCIKTYVEITRHIQEIHQLLHIYKFNLDNMLFFYTLNSNDILQRNPNIKLKKSDSIVINALTINIISSGKTLVDSIDTFLKENTNQYEMLKNNIISSVYDSCPYYRILYQLRNFSQHGHLPVQVEENNKCYLDLEDILKKPNINLNAKMKKEMIKFKEEIYEKFQDHPRIVFSLAIAEYNLCVIKIYKNFLENIEQLVLNFFNRTKQIIKKHPKIIHKSQDALNGYVLYDIDNDDNIQCFYSKEDFVKTFLTIKKEGLKIYKNDEKEFKEFIKRFKKNFRYN